MPSVNLFDSSMGIQHIMPQANPEQSMPTARPLAASMLREAGLEELYSANTAEKLLEQSLCPEVGDGELLRPDIFSTTLHSTMENLRGHSDPAVQALLKEVLTPLKENNELLRAYTGLMVGG